MSTTQRYWFPAKRYGWGWSFPQTWQGWVVFAIWMVALIFGVLVIRPRIHPIQTEAFVVAMTAALVVICYWKGEPPRWRWGEDK
jgi:hypothetical protein